MPVFRSEKASSLRRCLKKSLLKLKGAGQRAFERKDREGDLPTKRRASRREGTEAASGG